MSAGDPALLNEGLVGVEAIGSGASETGAGADSQPCREVWTPNQIVAYRVARARELRGWTQVEAARQLEPFLGVRLSPASFSAIERSVLGGRIRRFSGDEIVALARGFGVPLGWFFTPPPRSQLVSVQTPDAARDGLDPLELIDLALGDPTSLAEWQRALTEFSRDSRPTAGPPGDVPGCPTVACPSACTISSGSAPAPASARCSATPRRQRRCSRRCCERSSRSRTTRRWRSPATTWRTAGPIRQLPSRAHRSWPARSRRGAPLNRMIGDASAVRLLRR